MGIIEKPDAQRFRDRLDTLKKEQWLGTSRGWWPDFLFHHTNIDNAVSILQLRYVLSRSEMNLRQETFHDSASPDVIEKTDDQWKNYVRFYFRPRTPTFYNVEGFRPKRSQKYGKQCPIPIVFMFDMPGVICRADSKFSNRNLAIPHTPALSSAQEFEKLPFEQIYHDKWLPEGQQKNTIRGHRNAEVIVPKQIDLEHLRRIECRSKAEYDTLHHLLGDKLWRQWKDKITESSDQSLFHRYWTYIVNAELERSKIVFTIHPCSSPVKDAGPFDIRLKIAEITTGVNYEWRDATFTFNNNASNLGPFTLQRQPDNYVASLFIDDHLAYKNEFLDEPGDIPF